MEFENSKEITYEDLALFKDILNGEGLENIEVKIFAIKQLETLAKSLGPLRTRDELLDLIESQLFNFDDEVLYHLTEELEQFVPLVGGPEFSSNILSILLKISRTVDETIVRNKAIDAIKKLSVEIDQHLSEIFIANLLDVEDDISFAEKCSTLSLIPSFYNRASSDNKSLLRQRYSQIFEDNSAIVRNLAATELPNFIRILDIEHVLTDFLPLLSKIKEDDNNLVRINAVEIAMSIANKSKNQEIRNNMLQIIEELSKGNSWTIRQRVALSIDQIVETFNDDDFLPILIEIYENLTIDAETQVRKYAVQNIYRFTRNLYENFTRITNSNRKFEDIFLEKLMPIILSITMDISDEVQVALSSTLLCFSTIISNECFKNTILPLVIDSLEQPKPLLFKENLFKNLDYLPDDVNLADSFSSINKIIQNILITSEGSWRTRRSLLLTLVHLSKSCDKDFFKKNLLIYYIILLKDNTFAVRRTASIILPILVKRFGAKWLLTEIIPHIHATFKDEKYLFRYIILFCMQELIIPSIESYEIDKNIDKYLGGLKSLIQKDSRKYGITLCKILRLHNKLKATLQEKPFENIINTYTDNYNIKAENLMMYSEDVLETISKNNSNIFCIEENEHEMCYLEGLLILLNKEIQSAFKILVKDPINNIQDRAKYIILEIKKFSDNLNMELSNNWVIEYTNQIADNIWEQIDNELEKQMEEIEVYCNGIEKIDQRSIGNVTNSNPPVHSEENLRIVEKVEVFPSDHLRPDEIFTDEMESVEEESKDQDKI